MNIVAEKGLQSNCTKFPVVFCKINIFYMILKLLLGFDL